MHQQAQISWRSGHVPVSDRFDDPYFSLQDGLAETRHVFLGGNGLPARFKPGFHIAELGFGTGLNLLTTWQAWEAAGAPGPLTYTSFEAFPMVRSDMLQALNAFGELKPWVDRLASAWDGCAVQVALTPGLRLELVLGDARRTLPRWAGAADAWFLDGFAPARNPELWEADLLNAVARHTVGGGTAATYTAAGHVRRALSAAGFNVRRVPGFGRKRHMTCAELPE